MNELKTTFKFLHNKHATHYALIIDENDTDYFYLTLTHSTKYHRKLNLKLFKNPNFKDERDAYIITRIYQLNKSYFVETANHLVLSDEDKAQIIELIERKQKTMEQKNKTTEQDFEQERIRKLREKNTIQINNIANELNTTANVYKLNKYTDEFKEQLLKASNEFKYVNEYETFIRHYLPNNGFEKDEDVKNYCDIALISEENLNPKFKSLREAAIDHFNANIKEPFYKVANVFFQIDPSQIVKGSASDIKNHLMRISFPAGSKYEDYTVVIPDYCNRGFNEYNANKIDIMLSPKTKPFMYLNGVKASEIASMLDINRAFNERVFNLADNQCIVEPSQIMKKTNKSYIISFPVGTKYEKTIKVIVPLKQVQEFPHDKKLKLTLSNHQVLQPKNTISNDFLANALRDKQKAEEKTQQPTVKDQSKEATKQETTKQVKKEKEVAKQENTKQVKKVKKVVDNERER